MLATASADFQEPQFMDPRFLKLLTSRTCEGSGNAFAGVDKLLDALPPLARSDGPSTIVYPDPQKSVDPRWITAANAPRALLQADRDEPVVSLDVAPTVVPSGSGAAPAMAPQGAVVPLVPARAAAPVAALSSGSSAAGVAATAALAPGAAPITPPSDAASSPDSEPSPADTPFTVAQADQASPIPAPAQVPSAAPSDSGSPAASPSPKPTNIPIPPVPLGAGPVELIPPQPSASPAITPYPLPTETPNASASGPVFLVRPSGTPSPLTPKSGPPGAGGPATPAPPAAAPVPTLGPNEIVTIADHFIGSSDRRQPADLVGNVHVFFVEGQIVGDRAHWDGQHTLVVQGHTYLVNRRQDSILYGDKIIFDTDTRRATLLNGQGETIEGVAQGKLHYISRTLNATSDGVTHGEHASFTTCENPHAGYHVEARTIDITPGDKLVARKVVVFLGPTAIFYLPLLIIPLLQIEDNRREVSFLPLIGYDQAEGYFIKARIGFGTSNNYYGYYRVEYFTKRGLGLGYQAYIGAKDARRYTTIDGYTIDDRTQGARETNLNIQDIETFSRTLRAQFSVQYQSDYGPNLTLPAQVNITGSIIHQAGISTENLTFSRSQQGTLSDNINFGLLDTLTLGKYIQEQINLAYSRFLSAATTASDTLHIQSLTHWTTKGADYTLTYDKTDYSANPFGYDTVPQLQIIPHLTMGGFKYVPQIQLTLGEYSEPENHFSTSRFQGEFDENYYAKVLGSSDFTASYDLTQDYYGTGDAKAFQQQDASLNTPLGSHFVNSLTYNEQNISGPANVPFQLLDQLQPDSHSAQENIRFYNKNVYSLTLSTGTDFDRQAQPVNYQLNLQPSPRSYIVIGGFFSPGSGNGFGTSNVQAITPFGRDTTLELTTNVDWKNHERLEDKNIFLNRIIDNCYNLQFAYNQDLKSFNFNIIILAFPGQGSGFGLGGGNTSQIIPQGLTF